MCPNRIYKFTGTAVCAQGAETSFRAPLVVPELWFGHGSWYPSRRYKFPGTAIRARAIFRARQLVPANLCPVPVSLNGGHAFHRTQTYPVSTLTWFQYFRVCSGSGPGKKCYFCRFLKRAIFFSILNYFSHVRDKKMYRKNLVPRNCPSYYTQKVCPSNA